MIGSDKILALIPARGGSKGIKNKNIIDLCGKPLIAYTIEAAKKSRFIDRIVVTTDSEAIAEVARKYGADTPFMRPKKYAEDTSKTIDAVMHAIGWFQEHGERYDALVLLQPTVPLRDNYDIDAAIETFEQNEKEPIVSVCEADNNPTLIRSVGKNGRLEKLLDLSSTVRRQDMPKYYVVNGAIYINRIDDLSEHTSFNDNPVPYIMSKEHSVDIDEERDLLIIRAYMEL